MTFKKLLNYNIVGYKTSNWFLKFFKITLPLFTAFIIFVDPTFSGEPTLWQTFPEQTGSLVMAIWAIVFMLAYPFAVYRSVSLNYKKAKEDQSYNIATRKQLELINLIESYDA
jgi:disulfide bond formation protein DsbB